MAGGKRFLVDTLLLIGVACRDDRYHGYSMCIAERARSSGIELYVLPHTVGEALLKLGEKGGCSHQSAYDALEEALRRLGARLKGYDRNGFATLFYYLGSMGAGGRGRREGRHGPLYDIGGVIQMHGVSDILMIIALYADDEIDGLITIEPRLQRSPLIGILAEAYGREKIIGPAPHPALRECEYRVRGRL